MMPEGTGLPDAVSFDGTEIELIRRNGVPWIRGRQIADALGYKGKNQVVDDLFSRNADEFTPEMTAVIDLPTAGGVQKVRVFSPRGCYLLAMMARTPKAKAFRVWVLDVLEKLAPSHLSDRQPASRAPRIIALSTAIKAAAVRTGLTREAMRTRVYSRFGVGNLSQLKERDVQGAIELLRTMGVAPALPVPETRGEDAALPPPARDGQRPSAFEPAGLIRLEFSVSIEKAQKIIAIVAA